MLVAVNVRYAYFIDVTVVLEGNEYTETLCER